MLNWLSSAVANDGCIITANRRLAREFSETYANQQVAAGESAWRSPAIYSWQDWLATLYDTARDDGTLPARISGQQSQLVWEQCLASEFQGAGVSISSLAKMCRDTWQRMADWQVNIQDVARTAQSDDQRLFAVVAGRYLARLENENWLDDPGLGEVVLQLLGEQQIAVSGNVTFAGFERQRPLVRSLGDALAAMGNTVEFAELDSGNEHYELQAFANEVDEYRAAGTWAAEHISQNPEARIAIVANGLDAKGDTVARHVREGATPGWQYGPDALAAAVDVSYGRRLAEYPAAAVALLLLRWIDGELGSMEVGQLLRSPLLGKTEVGGRTRLELCLRRIPDRAWSPSMISAELRGKDESDDATDWLTRLAAFSKRRRELPKSAPPAIWVERVDEVLRDFGWPGSAALDSAEFQLINRWRELLNEFARLGSVAPRMSARAAVSKLESMARDTVFQPESKGARIQLLGPLEAAGLRFDAIWLTGVTAANWPPTAYPLALISRRLQREQDMPDASPSDTVKFAKLLLSRMIAAGSPCVCSFPQLVDDEEQTVSDLLDAGNGERGTPIPTGGWHAAQLLRQDGLLEVPDKVPPVSGEERIAGGAATVQRQRDEPFSAFVESRLRASSLYPQAVGIPPLIRGNLIHDALHQLYIDLPDSGAINNWSEDDRRARIATALDSAFNRQQRNTDAVLQALLTIERQRIADLLRAFISADTSRGEFTISSVEGKFEFVQGPVRFPLRFDRIDTVAGGGIAILDYKTGAPKRLLNRDAEAVDIQLFVYAAATEAPVSALALVNVDTRQISFDGAGQGYSDEEEWPVLLERVKAEVASACQDLAAGDVRINMEQSISAARSLNLLSRYTELRHRDG